MFILHYINVDIVILNMIQKSIFSFFFSCMLILIRKLKKLVIILHTIKFLCQYMEVQ
jgi:hypothetical protein